jgi:hypothetical protein
MPGVVHPAALVCYTPERMSLRAPAAFAAVALCGCHGCHGSHPYVPYTIGPAEAAATTQHDAAPAQGASAAAPDAGDTFGGIDATAAPPGTTRWPIQGLVLQAPPGLVFVSAVVRDVDGDGQDDAFAIARPTDGGDDPGAVVFYRGRPGATPLAPSATIAPSPDLARSDGCAPVDRLVLIGAHAVLAELGAHCPLHAATRPDRWVAIVSAAGGAPRVRLAMTVADPPGAPALSVDGNTSDRDGDGLPDVALRVTLEGGGAPLEPGPRVSATFAWLDRPAGLSRDPGATEGSFAALASEAAARATRAGDAPSVPAFVTQVRALWRAVCPDGGSPRIVAVAGTGAVPCGAARALEQAGLAEVHAYVMMGDPLHAALALDAAPAPGPSRAAEARRWIETLAPAAGARLVRPVLAVPVVAGGREPSWGSLAFESSGKLLVRTRAGVVRVDPDEGDEGAADDVPAWRSAVVSPDGATRWVEAYDPCDGLALRATFAGGDDRHDLALPVPPPIGARCAGSRGALARVIPIAWGPGGLEAIVGDGPVIITADLEHAVPLAGLLGQPGTLGAPLSPDGRTLVVATGAGLLVRSPDRTRLLRAPELDGTYADQRDCTVSNDASHVACVHTGRAWVGAWD